MSEVGSEYSMRRRTYRAGERVFHEGDPGDCVYLIESGTIELSKSVGYEGEQVVITCLGRGEILGEMALIDGKPRSATARVTSDAVLLPVSAGSFTSKLDGLDPVMRRVMGRFVSIIRNNNDDMARKAKIIR